jgi:hypothetical protein
MRLAHGMHDPRVPVLRIAEAHGPGLDVDVVSPQLAQLPGPAAEFALQCHEARVLAQALVRDLRVLGQHEEVELLVALHATVALARLGPLQAAHRVVGHEPLLDGPEHHRRHRRHDEWAGSFPPWRGTASSPGKPPRPRGRSSPGRKAECFSRCARARPSRSRWRPYRCQDLVDARVTLDEDLDAVLAVGQRNGHGRSSSCVCRVHEDCTDLHMERLPDATKRSDGRPCWT